MSEFPALPFGNRQAYFETEINLLRRERKGVINVYNILKSWFLHSFVYAIFLIFEIDHACYQKRVIVC